MSAKSDTPAAGADAASSAASASPATRGGMAAWLPVIVGLIFTPAATWATVEFVLVPRLQKKIAAQSQDPSGHSALAESAPESSAGHGGGGHGAKGGKDGKEGGANFEFQNIVVNLAGTMGTRYLKVSFMVTGAEKANIKGAFEGAKPRLTDVTLNVLSALTLADLEEPGAKNVIREKLVNAYNQALGHKVAEQVYFSDFVIQ